MKLHAVALRETIKGSAAREKINSSKKTATIQRVPEVQNIMGTSYFDWVDATWVGAEWATARVEELLLGRRLKSGDKKLRLRLLS